MALKFAVQSLCRSFNFCSIRAAPIEATLTLFPLCNSLPSLRNLSTSAVRIKPVLRPYMLFVAEKRKSVEEANPGVKVTDVACMLGQMWRLLPESDKTLYRNRYEEEKAKRETFMANLSDEEKARMQEDARLKKHLRLKKRRRKLQKDLNKPVARDVNPFLLYVKANQMDRGDAPLSLFVKGLSEHWKKMPEDDKEEFMTAAKANSVRHRAQLAEWKKQMFIEGHAAALGLQVRRKKGVTKSKKTAIKRRQSIDKASGEAVNKKSSKPKTPKDKKAE